MKRLFIILLILFVSLPTTFAQDTPETSTCPPHQTSVFDEVNTMFEVEVDGQTRHYRLYVPESYDPEQAMPLVIVFPGATQSVTDIAVMSGWHLLGEEEGFITVYPQITNRWWNDGVVTIPAVLETDDVAFTQALIDDITQKWCVDGDHIFASGVSNGADMSARLACELSDQIAAVGAVAGGHFPLKDGCEPDRPIPIIVFFGTEDEVIPYEGGDSAYFAVLGFADMPSVEEGMNAWAELNGCELDSAEEAITSEVSLLHYNNCDAEVALYRIDGGGHAWPGGFGETNPDIDATALMWAFFVEHTDS